MKNKFRLALILSLACILLVGGVVTYNIAGNNKVVTTNVNNVEEDDKVSGEEKVDNSNNKDSKESNGSVEDAAYVEKYVQQQIKGQMPDGADGKKVVYLTFDDGPSQNITPRVLDTLKSKGVNATFFVVGMNVETDSGQELIKRAVKEGNQIQIHSYKHDYNYLYPGNKINIDNCLSDFQKTEDAIKSVLGEDYKTRALRFPGGQMTWAEKDPQGAAEIDKLLAEKDLHQIDWNCLNGDAEDNKPKTADSVYQKFVTTLGNREKAVLLMHDASDKSYTAEALPRIIDYLKENGYEFKTIA